MSILIARIFINCTTIQCIKNLFSFENLLVRGVIINEKWPNKLPQKLLGLTFILTLPSFINTSVYQSSAYPISSIFLLTSNGKLRSKDGVSRSFLLAKNRPTYSGASFSIVSAGSHVAPPTLQCTK